MTGLRAPLSRYEEVALCKVGFGSRDSLNFSTSGSFFSSI